MKRSIHVSILFFLVLHLASAQFKPVSVLASGNWYKVGVTDDGIYKIDSKFLTNIGIDPTKINPQNIKIYANGGGMLSQNISTPRIDDLAENAIFVVGQADGKFDATDYILFYAKGPQSWVYDSLKQGFTHIKNIYSDSAFYFISISNSAGKRITVVPDSGNADITYNSYDAYLVHEDDNFNIIQEGRTWYGDAFDAQTSYSYSFNLQGLVPGSTVNLATAAAVKTSINSSSTFTYSLGNSLVGSVNVTCPYCDNQYVLGGGSSGVFQISADKIANPSVTLTVNYTKGSNANAVGYLDYLEFNYKSPLQLYGSQTRFRCADSKKHSVSTYIIGNTQPTSLVWDITDPVNVFQQTNSGQFTSGSKNIIKEYIVFTPESINANPVFVSKVTNQNLHGLSATDFLIVTHSSLLTQANQLAVLRRSEGMNVSVATVDQIYNEFSSGAQDISAIRDLSYMLYKRAGLKNLLLFGSCSYDYKNRVINNTNLVPCYEARESFNVITAYSSEDYYGFFGINQGDWPEAPATDYVMQIGIGRIPVKNPDEAASVVAKLTNYSSVNSLGKWRNKICFIADNDQSQFLSDADALANYLDTAYKYLDVNKIYLDAYPLVSTPSGNQTPQVNDQIKRAVNQGSLIMNYIGHGGVEILAQEQIVTIPLIKTYSDKNTLPFWVTATCDFATYDNPAKVSGAVTMLIQPEIGGIGLISATRPVYENTNTSLNNAFYGIAFKPDSIGKMPTLGDIIKYTKNNSLSGTANRSYTLLGDPSLTLNYPRNKVVITAINSDTVKNIKDTVKALSLLTVKGEIRDGKTGMLMNGFNGILNADIYDKYSFLSTLGQLDAVPRISYYIRNNLFYSGDVSIQNGIFSFSFIVPKDIGYQFGTGKISLYASDNIVNQDATGAYNSFLIGGSNPLAKIDTTPPNIQLFINDTTFKSGQITGSNPILVGHFHDESGINISTSSIGHEITSILNKDDNTITFLNDYYTSALNDFKHGKVVYGLNELPEGNYSIQVKAWDVYNNSATDSIDFVVKKSDAFVINHLMNYPNPVSDKTMFAFSHNRAGEDLSISIYIYDLSGKIIQEIKEDIPNSNSTIDIPWEFKLNTSYTISQGTYVYKCVAKSKKDNAQTQAFQKLVLIH